MSDQRAVRVATAFARRAAAAPPGHLCSACVDVLAVDGAGVTLMSGRNSGPVCSSDERIGVLEDLQFTLGSGPCRDAFESGVPVIEPDLERTSPERWPGFLAPAIEAGTMAVFAFPMRTGEHQIGVMTLYRDEAGGLSEQQTADGLLVADVLARTMVSVQSKARGDLLSADLSDDGAHRAEVHQATGMLAVQLGVSVDEASARLRAHAFASDRSVAEVAQDVVARRLELSDDLRGGAA